MSSAELYPRLAFHSVLNVPILQLLATWDGVEGAHYETFGIELANGEILNVSSPSLPFQVDSTTRTVTPDSDTSDYLIHTARFVGRRLKNLIYFFEDGTFRHYLAILETGDYLTSYHSFNCTEFAIGRISDWKPGMESRLDWCARDLTTLAFFNAWDDGQINPFAVYS